MSTTTTAVVNIVSLQQTEHALRIVWSDAVSTTFHYLWLRDNCSTAFHPDTHERNFDQLSVSAAIHPLQVSIENDTLRIHWSEQEHHSVFTFDWLRQHAYANGFRASSDNPSVSWDQDFLERIPSADYAELMRSDEALYHWMRRLDRDGLSLVRNMPASEADALTQIATRVDYQRQTNFGVTFEVRSVPKPINLAYTALALPLHTDLANQETPPGYQFLHCLINDSTGGESVFADGLRVLEDLRAENPEHFQLLATHAIPFRFEDESHEILHHHPVINVDYFGQIVEIKYNAHLADIFDLPEAIMHAYYLAYRDLMARLRAPKYRIQFALKSGEMAVFDNRRVLHGRTAFDPSSGLRHLRGCYVDRTEFKSRLRVLAREFA